MSTETIEARAETVVCSHCGEAERADYACSCDACGNSFCETCAAGRLQMLGDDHLCADCFSADGFCCAYCGEAEHVDDGRSCDHCGDTFCVTCAENRLQELGDEYFCENCFSDHGFICAHCGEGEHVEDSYSCEDCEDQFCRTCYDYRMISCVDCGRLFCFECAESCLHIRGEDYYCADCHDPDRSIQGCGYEPILRFYRAEDEAGRGQYGADAKTRYLGVELEIDGKESDDEACIDQLRELDPDEALYCLKEDGSLSDRGIEIATQPCTVAFHRASFPWKRICAIAAGCGFKSHDTSTCGLHVHVSKAPLSYSQSVKMGLFVYAHPNIMGRFARRKASGYSSYKPTKEALRDKARSQSRYEAVNYSPATTIEFRLFKGTLREATILASVEFVDCLARFAANYPAPRVLLHGAWGAFIRYARARAEEYPELVRYMEAKSL